ncbi:MAG: hypothetical protein KC503_26645 [Myxococcales bacterium]|nr:hypothetical protein [Myxococcales bacterium]
MLLALEQTFSDHPALASDLELSALLPAPKLEPLHRAREIARVRSALAGGGWGFCDSHALAVVRPLPWDSAHFGLPCADLMRVYASADASAATVAAVVYACLDESAQRGIRLHTARVLAEQTAAVAALSRRGFQLLDTSVELGASLSTMRRGRRPPSGVAASASPTVQVRPARDADRARLRDIAQTFTDNRFFRDPRISDELARGVYRSWVDSALDAETLLCAVGRDGIGGLASFIPPSDELRVGTVGLVVIAPEQRGSGLFDPLVQGCAQRAGGRALVTSTQVSNARSLRAFARHGLLPLRARHVFHHWSTLG